MEEQIFISHTFQDVVEINELIQAFFKDSGIKPFIATMETYRRGEKPNWVWIKEEIEKSKALLLFITPKILEKEHTQNWIAYETGIASASNPPKPVWIFQVAPIEFKIPYLTHYILMTEFATQAEASRLSENKIFEVFKMLLQAIGLLGLREAIKKPETSFGLNIKCSNCRVNFNYFDFTLAYKKFPCPSCPNNIEVPTKEVKYDEELSKIE